MKLNIKNARRLETSIDAEISRMIGKIRNTTGGFSDAKSAIESKESSVESNVSKIKQLRHVRKFIRDLIGKFNEEKGINSLTSEIAALSSDIEVAHLIVRINDVSSDSYSNTNSYRQGVSEDFREKYHAESLKLTRAVQRLKDKCQGINSTGTIELGSDLESFLKKNGLMD